MTSVTARLPVSSSSTLFAASLPSPIGPLLAVQDGEGGLVRLDFLDPGEDARAVLTRRRLAGVVWSAAPFTALTAALERYFEHGADLLHVPVAPQGTPFQRAVWQALRAVPRGRTTSYKQLAHAVGRPQAVRAVGAANGANPIALVVPCHRAIGSDGRLVGYAGGLERKRALLLLEGAAFREQR